MKQIKQTEWFEQWCLIKENEITSFLNWIYPYKLEDFKDKTVLECGCGCGQHTAFIAPYAKEIIAVDLNTVDVAKGLNNDNSNVSFIEADIATMELNRKFDIVISIGVVHHTDDPDKTFENLKKHVNPDGILIIWVYSYEGNFLFRNILEPIRKVFLRKIDRKSLLNLSKLITLLLYIPVYSIYKLPLTFLPYYKYFEGFRKRSFQRNFMSIFDKLNAPQVDFIKRSRLNRYFNEKYFKDIHISSLKGTSWRGSGRLKSTH